MDAVLITALNVVVVVALCVSVVRFWSESRYGSESVRRLAALSSAITLLVVAMIYSGEFRHQTLLALQELGASQGLYDTCRDILVKIDHTFTDIANAINGVIGADDVSYRPEPPFWPAALLLISYSIRFLIYRSHTRKGNVEAALTGAAYWSHITAFALVLAFLIVVSGANPVVLLPASLVVLAAIVVSVKLLAEDFGLGLKIVLKTLWTTLVNLAGRIAYLATELAAVVRTLLSYASKLYLEKVRGPFRRRVEAIERRNERVRKKGERRLSAQNRRHAERFGQSESRHRGDPPSGSQGWTDLE